PGAHGQMLQNLGPKQAPITSFNYRVRAAEVGEFTIPQFVVNVYSNLVTVPAARLQVVPAAEPVPPPQRLLLEMAATNLFAGQASRVRVRFPVSPFGGIQVPAQVQLTGQGFIVDQGIVQQSVLPVPGQPNAVSFNYETIITPISSGKITLFAQAFTGGNRFSGPVVITGNATIPAGSPQYALLESDPIDLEVSPLSL